MNSEILIQKKSDIKLRPLFEIEREGIRRNDLFGKPNQANQSVSRKRLRGEQEVSPSKYRALEGRVRVSVKINSNIQTCPKKPLSPTKLNLNTIQEIQNTVVRKQLFKTNEEESMDIENHENYLSTSKLQKTKRRGEILTNNSRLKRPRLEVCDVKENAMEIELQKQNLWLPMEIWQNIVIFFTFNDCANFALTAKKNAQLIYDQVFISALWLSKMKNEYESNILSAEPNKGNKILALLERSVKKIQIAEHKNFLSISNIKLNTIELLKAVIFDYNDTENFILNLLLGNKTTMLSFTERTQHLELTKDLCTKHDLNYAFCHARKIIEHFIRWEDTNHNLHKKALVRLLFGLKQILNTNNVQEQNKWLELLDSSFNYLISQIEHITWFNSCIFLLKLRIDTHEIEECKNKIIRIIGKYLPVFLAQKQKFVILEVKNSLKSRNLSEANKAEITALLSKLKI